MLIFKYKKQGEAAFLSHLDTLRAITRTIRRAKIDINYSKGYNPHMLLFMSPPLPLGSDTISEYCTADTDIKAEEFIKKYNKFCLKGLECLNAVNVVKNPNIAGNVTAALYSIKNDNLKDNFNSLIKDNKFIISYQKKGNLIQKDVFSDILNLEKTDNGINALLKFGNFGNLRIDRFLNTLNADCSEALKIESYCQKNGKNIAADEYILDFVENQKEGINE